jgi:D-threo-aldose 1-dehydrogenase
MRTITLGETGIATSALGLGCADLFRLPTGRGRRFLLDAAYDVGIRHFDVAPMYGLGRVEEELGRFLRAGRAEAVVATKFGIEPTRAGLALAPVQGSLQRLRRRTGDPRAGAAGGLLHRTVGHDARTARTSLERSLRLLGRDHVDLLFLHEPVADVSDELFEFLETAREQGRLCAWGAAGERAAACLRAPVLQTRWRGAGEEPDPRPTIRYGVLAGAPAGPDREARAAARLREALAAEPRSPVLFSTTRPEHVRAAAAAAERGPE